MMTAIRSTHILQNQRTDGDIALEVDLFLTTEQHIRVGVQEWTGKEDGGEIGVTIGGEVTLSAGFPYLVEGTTKGKTEVSGKYIRKDIHMTISDNEDTKVKRVSDKTGLFMRALLIKSTSRTKSDSD
jgi:hypothetical protein